MLLHKRLLTVRKRLCNESFCSSVKARLSSGRITVATRHKSARRASVDTRCRLESLPCLLVVQRGSEQGAVFWRRRSGYGRGVDCGCGGRLGAESGLWPEAHELPGGIIMVLCRSAISLLWVSCVSCLTWTALLPGRLSPRCQSGCPGRSRRPIRALQKSLRYFPE